MKKNKKKRRKKRNERKKDIDGNGKIKSKDGRDITQKRNNKKELFHKMLYFN